MALFGRRVVDALAEDERPVGNIFVRAARLGLPTSVVRVAKEARHRGRSNWNALRLVRFAGATLREAWGRPALAGRVQEPIARCGWADPKGPCRRRGRSDAQG